MWTFWPGLIPIAPDPKDPVVIPKPPSMTTTYVLIVVVVVLTALVAVFAVNTIRSGEDNSVIEAAIFVGLPPTLGAILAFFKAQQVGTQVDGGFTQFAKALQERAHAAGIQEAEDRQTAVKVDEARIAGLVAQQVAAFLASREPSTVTPPPTATATVNVTPEAVTVEEMKPQAAQAIADAVRPDVIEAVADALPAPPRDPDRS